MVIQNQWKPRENDITDCSVSTASLDGFIPDGVRTSADAVMYIYVCIRDRHFKDWRKIMISVYNRRNLVGRWHGTLQIRNDIIMLKGGTIIHNFTHLALFIRLIAPPKLVVSSRMLRLSPKQTRKPYLDLPRAETRPKQCVQGGHNSAAPAPRSGRISLFYPRT